VRTRAIASTILASSLADPTAIRSVTGLKVTNRMLAAIVATNKLAAARA
jgi:hypothetical protein